MGIKETFRVLANSKSQHIVPALIHALGQQDERIVVAAVDGLMQQRDSTGYATLLDRYPSLPPAAREIISAGVYRMSESLSTAVRTGSPRTRGTVLEMLEGNTSVDSLSLLVLFLTDDSPEVRARVSRSIENIVRRFAEEKAISEGKAPRGTRRITTQIRSPERIAEDLRAILKALGTALDSIAFHQSTSLLATILLLGEEGSDLILEALKHEGRVNSTKESVVDQLVRDNSEQVWRFVMGLLGNQMAYFRSIGRDVLLAKKGPEAVDGLVAVLTSMSEEAQRQLIRMNNGVPWLVLLNQDTGKMGSDYCRFLLREVERLEVDQREKVPYFQAIAHSGFPDVARACVDKLSRIPSREASDALAGLLDSRNEDIQVQVIEELAAQHHPNLHKLLAPKVTSTSEKVRKLAGKILARESFEKYLESFDRLDERTRELAGKAVVGLDESAIDHLALNLNDIDPSKRVRAIRIIQATGTHGKLEQQVLELVKDPDKKVRATTIQLLVEMKNTEAIKALIKLLSDKDPRVQANAVEAIETINNPAFKQLLVPFLRSSNNRTRGNAVKALWTLGVQEVAPIMFAMLEDADPKMRMTAAWVIRECRPTGGAERIRAAHQREIDGGVRARMEAALTAMSSQRTGTAVVGRPA